MKKISPLVWVLSVYGLIVGVFTWRSMDAIGPDGVSYILLAEHTVRGEWTLAITGFWSPLLSWLLVPFITFGIDPLHGFHVMAVFIGAGFVIGVWLLTARFMILMPLRILVTLVSAVRAAVFTLGMVTPDLLVADLLAVYFYLTLDPRLGREPRLGFALGIAAGLAYLAKAYAGPFFLVHATALMGGFAYLDKRKELRLQWLRSWLSALAGFILIAGPWIGVISMKYGHPTFSTAAGYNHAIIAPDNERARSHPMGPEIWPLVSGRLNLWEDPTLIPHNDWSPFESRTNLKHQVDQTLQAGWKTLGMLGQLDVLKLGLAAFAVAAVLLLRGKEDDARKRIYRWSVLTVAAYGAGYALVGLWMEFRYYWPVDIVLLALVFHFVDRICRRLKIGFPGWSIVFRKAVVTSAIVISVASFAISPIRTLAYWMSEPPRGLEFRVIAQDLDKRGLRGPIASTEWHEGLYLSYYLGQTYVGRPSTLGPELEQKLRSVGVRTFLVWGPAYGTDALLVGREMFHLIIRYRAVAHPGLGMDVSVYRVASGYE